MIWHTLSIVRDGESEAQNQEPRTTDFESHRGKKKVRVYLVHGSICIGRRDALSSHKGCDVIHMVAGGGKHQGELVGGDDFADEVQERRHLRQRSVAPVLCPSYLIYTASLFVIVKITLN